MESHPQGAAGRVCHTLFERMDPKNSESLKETSQLIKVSEDGLVVKQILQPGSGVSPCKNDIVTIDYEASYTVNNMEVRFDSSKERNVPFTFQLGEGAVVKCLEEAVLSMRVGERARVHSHWSHAFGKFGLRFGGVRIPPTQDVIFDIVLLKVETPPETRAVLTLEQRIDLSRNEKELGNKAFSQQDYEGAKVHYSKALTYFEDLHNLTAAETSTITKLKVTLWLNLALCELKTENYTRAINYCERVLKVEETNLKALYRKGQALEACGQWAAARNAYYLAARIEPTGEARKAYEAIKQKMEAMKRNVKEKNKLYGAFTKDRDNNNE
jgi:FK506-binding protein 4/5